MKQKYLVTPALTYANGPIHLGHLLEHIQVSIFSNALKMAGHDVLTVCGADSHGTPIEMSAMANKVSPEDFVTKCRQEQEKSLKNFFVEFDGGYGSTHTEENRRQAESFFASLQENGHIIEREIEQLYDPKLKRFLPDRMVKGTCPKCQAQNQYGDSCEVCGATYSPDELIDPISSLSGSKPVQKKSNHLFVNLKNFEADLKKLCLNESFVTKDVLAYLNHWMKDGLKEWNISRDAPYFGFEIPGFKGKYFYVWLDAPIGYVSLTEKAASEKGLSYKDYWCDPDTKIIHFIGKDIVYFHTLFWPALLLSKGFTLPSKINVHGMLTINGEKMSKSRGTFIAADTFCQYFPPESLRYYYACKLSNRIEDIDLHFGDFVSRVNADLVNKIVNVISRTLPLLQKNFNGLPSLKPEQSITPLLDTLPNMVKQVKEHFVNNEPQKALKEIVLLSEQANKYLQDSKPWVLIKTDKEKAHEVLSSALFLGKVSFGLLKPVLPSSVKKLENMVNQGKEFTFDNILDWFSDNQKLEEYQHLFTRIEEKSVSKIIEDTKSQHGEKKVSAEKAKENKDSKSSYIGIEDFLKVDLRAGKILKAEEIKDSQKLLSLTVDLGELGTRSIFAGLKEYYCAADLEGRTVAVVANLQPRKMRFGTSEGMVLACGGTSPSVLFLDNVNPGDKIG